MAVIKLVALPRQDRDFQALVAEVFSSIATPPTTEVLELRLRGTYPSARVVEQAALAQIGDGIAWYVYRDGSVATGDGV